MPHSSSFSRRPATTVGAWGTLIALGLIALLPQQGMTLCVGHDGHVGVAVIEASVAHCPCESGAQDSREQDVWEREVWEQRCPPVHAPCDDIPLQGVGVLVVARTADEGAGRDITPTIELSFAVTSLPPAISLLGSQPRLSPSSPHDHGHHARAVAPLCSARRLL